MRVVGLVADAFAAALGASPVSELHDLIDRRRLRVVDWCRADLLGKREPVGVAVDHHDLPGALQDRRIGRHQADGPGAVDHD